MKIVVIGGVNSSALLVDKLRAHGFDDVHVFGYVPEDVSHVSGWADLSQSAAKAGYRFTPFVRVVDCLESVKQLAASWLFAVGLSQLIPPEMLAASENGAIGFHPTALPKGRGRAPIAWLVLDQQNGAATFFRLREGIDDGPILAQAPFEVGPEDDARSVEQKVLTAEALALDELLPALRAGRVLSREQDSVQATFTGRRTPDDGWIDWNLAASTLLRLIRASTTPHPGAYSFCGDVKLTVLRANIANLPDEKGVVGRIVRICPDGSFVVQCGQGHLCVTGWKTEGNWVPRVGQRLGYYVELEVFALRRNVKELERRLADMEELVRSLVRRADNC